MQFDFSFLENQHEAQAFTFSAGVIVLSIIAVVAFIFSGSSIIFYAFAILAVVLGLYMTYHISKTPTQTTSTQKRRQTKR